MKNKNNRSYNFMKEYRKYMALLMPIVIKKSVSTG